MLATTIRLAVPGKLMRWISGTEYNMAGKQYPAPVALRSFKENWRVAIQPIGFTGESDRAEPGVLMVQCDRLAPPKRENARINASALHASHRIYN
jgi:hypothetical protein